MHKIIALLCGILMVSTTQGQATSIPQGFDYISKKIPLVVLDIRYAKAHNFTGKPVKAYQKPKAILSEPALKQLKKAYLYFLEKGFVFKIFDAYRPQTAVNHFMAWAKDRKDTLAKTAFYPEIPKKDLFRLGYIATQSGHSRGSTIDLTLVDIKTGVELDMGSPFDFFGKISHHNSALISKEQQKNREILKRGMRKFGFIAYPKEWWHYTLYNEPYPNTYFDFEIR